MVPPVPAPVEIGRGVVIAQTTADLVDGKIIDRVLDRPADGASIGGRNVAILEPVGEGAAALGRGAGRVARILVVGGGHLGIGNHGGVPVLPVDLAADALDVGVGQHVVGVGSALGRPVPEGGTGVGHEADVSPYVDQGPDILFVCVWLKDVEECCTTTELYIKKFSIYIKYKEKKITVLYPLKKTALTRSQRVKISS